MMIGYGLWWVSLWLVRLVWTGYTYLDDDCGSVSGDDLILLRGETNGVVVVACLCRRLLHAQTFNTTLKKKKRMVQNKAKCIHMIEKDKQAPIKSLALSYNRELSLVTSLLPWASSDSEHAPWPPIRVSIPHRAWTDPGNLRTTPSLVLPLPVEVVSVVLLQVDKILSLLLITGVYILFFFYDVRALANVMAYRHFLGARSCVSHTSLCLFDASRSQARARGGFVHLGAAIGPRRHTDHGAGAVTVPPERVQRAAQQAIEVGHHWHGERHERVVHVAVAPVVVAVAPDRERVAKEWVHHRVHLAHHVHVRSVEKMGFWADVGAVF